MKQNHLHEYMRQLDEFNKRDELLSDLLKAAKYNLSNRLRDKLTEGLTQVDGRSS